MPTLRALTEKLEPGDYLAWIGDKADDGDRVHPKQVQSIDKDGTTIRVDAEGVRGGSYFYRVNAAGDGEAFFDNPNKQEPIPMGEIIFAELTDSDDPVMVKRGYYDNR